MKKPFTTRELAEQLRAQGRVILMLVAEREARSKIDKANTVARIMSEEGRADLPERASNEDYGKAVRTKTLTEDIADLLHAEGDRIIKNLNPRVTNAIEDTGEYCSHCGASR